jgi:hypothetical protein
MLRATLALTKDCEAFRDGWIGQPANTVSSVAFAVLGLWLLSRARRSPARGLELSLFAVVAFATAAGSIAFHGPHPTWGQWAHDVPIAAGLLLACCLDAATLRGGSRRWLLAWPAGVVVVGVVLAASPDAQRAVFTALGVALAGLEVAATRRHLRPWPGDHDFGRWLFVLGTFVVGSAAFFLGRLDALCDPASVWQPHAVWHVLLAVAIGTYAHVAVQSTVTETT